MDDTAMWMRRVDEACGWDVWMRRVDEVCAGMIVRIWPPVDWSHCFFTCRSVLGNLLTQDWETKKHQHMHSMWQFGTSVRVLVRTWWRKEQWQIEESRANSSLGSRGREKGVAVWHLAEIRSHKTQIAAVGSEKIRTGTINMLDDENCHTHVSKHASSSTTSW